MDGHKGALERPAFRRACARHDREVHEDATAEQVVHPKMSVVSQLCERTLDVDEGGATHDGPETQPAMIFDDDILSDQLGKACPVAPVDGRGDPGAFDVVRAR